MVTKMNLTTISGLPTLTEGPNYFEVSAGLTPGQGQFMMDGVSWEALKKKAKDVDTVVLTMEDNETIMSLAVVVLGAEVCGSSVDDDHETDKFLVRLTDERIYWRCITADDKYNMLTPGRDDYIAGTLSGDSDAWTSQELVAELCGKLVVDEGTLPYTPETVVDLFCDYRPIPQVLNELLDRIGCYAAYDIFNSYLSFCRVGEEETKDKNELDALLDRYCIEKKDAEDHFHRPICPEKLVVLFKRFEPGKTHYASEDLTDDYAVYERTYSTYITTEYRNGTPKTGTKHVIICEDILGQYDGKAATYDNATAMSDKADELATNYFGQFKKQQDDIGLYLLHNLVPNSIIRSVRWVSDAQGSRTILELHNTSPAKRLERFRSPVLREVPATTFGVITDAGDPFYAKVSDEDGSSVGDQDLEVMDLSGKGLSVDDIGLIIPVITTGGEAYTRGFFPYKPRYEEFALMADDEVSRIWQTNAGTNYKGVFGLYRRQSGSTAEQRTLFHSDKAYGVPRKIDYLMITLDTPWYGLDTTKTLSDDQVDIRAYYKIRPILTDFDPATVTWTSALTLSYGTALYVGGASFLGDILKEPADRDDVFVHYLYGITVGPSRILTAGWNSETAIYGWDLFVEVLGPADFCFGGSGGNAAKGAVILY